ncbi:MAG TPA: hypothetical protein DEB42_00550 [Jeotgalicoccus sp.]|nr:hypothetical protein [Jeotgalicoccus sp.]
MELETIKRHLRVIDNFEDDTILMYLEWAEEKVKDAITNDPLLYEEFFDNNSHYQRAVILLTAHYFSNRLPLSDKPQYNLTFGFRDALSHLRANFMVFKKELEDDDYDPFN